MLAQGKCCGHSILLSSSHKCDISWLHGLVMGHNSRVHDIKLINLRNRLLIHRPAWHALCYELVEKFLNFRDSWPFLEPVDPKKWDVPVSYETC